MADRSRAKVPAKGGGRDDWRLIIAGFCCELGYELVADDSNQPAAAPGAHGDWRHGHRAGGGDDVERGWFVRRGGQDVRRTAIVTESGQ